MPPPFERPSLLRASAYAVHQPVLVRAIARICDGCADSSACDHHFLVETPEEWFLADVNAGLGEPFGDFLTPQIERKGFQFGQQRSPNVAQRMPPPRQIIIHNDDLSAWLYDAKKLAERSLAILAGLLMQ